MTSRQASAETARMGDAHAATCPPPIVIVGSGPVGVRVTQELHSRCPNVPVVLYGAEPYEPYNRVRLSSFLAGELAWDALTRDLELPRVSTIERRFGCAVRSIDRQARVVVDAAGRVQPYSTLVLATGSTPHIPAIDGIALPGVYAFRNFDDAQKLLARRARSHRTVVLGGGLLGLEAARAMQRLRTEVIVVEHAERIMSRQLDSESAAFLQVHLERLGITVIRADGARRVLGDEHVTGVELMSRAQIKCDTVVVATGIRPSTSIALAARIAVGRGVRVDDEMRTSDPSIFAVGECAEHRGLLYGLLAPGLEQATVAAATIAGGRATYAGSTLATRLKVAGTQVFSVGTVIDEEIGGLARVWTHRSRDGKCCGKVVVKGGRLIGASAVGPAPGLGRLQEAVTNSRAVWVWQLWRYRYDGRLWPDGRATNVAGWPAGVTVCNCTGVTRGAIGEAIAAGCRSADALAARTGASTVCGSCRPLLVELAGDDTPLRAVRGWRPLLASAAVAMLAALAVALPFAVPYTDRVEVPWRWDEIWRNSQWRQVSGYTVLVLSALSLVMSLRKRMTAFRFGDFPLWRVLHAIVGALTLVGLFAHTGGRLGSNLDFALMVFFLGLAAAGGWAGGLVSLEHRFGGGGARLRRRSVWVHILMFWPIPLLLSFHVLKSYYF